jgi:DNA repair protein RecO (recombination protein O)
LSTRAAIATPAIVVRLVDFGDSDRIVGLFTESLGLVSAVARNARRSRKRFAGALQTGHRLDVELVRGRGSLARLESAQLVDPHLGISKDLGRLEEAASVLRAVRDHMAEGVPDPAIFESLARYLTLLDHEPASAVRLVAFRLSLFDRLGVGPELERCVSCGRQAPPERSAGFAPNAGGLVCRACGGGSLVLSAASRTLARELREGHGAAASETSPGLRESALELGRALDALESYHLSHRRDG